MSLERVITNTARSCLESFELCTTHDSMSRWAEDAKARLCKWAANAGVIGALIHGPICLDWRLRYRQDWVQDIVELLNELNDDLRAMHRTVENQPTEDYGSSSGSNTNLGGDIFPSLAIQKRLQIGIKKSIDELFKLSDWVKENEMHGKCAAGWEHAEYRNGVNLTAQFQDRITNLLASKKPPLAKYMSARLAKTISIRQRQLSFLQKCKRDREETSMRQEPRSHCPSQPILSQPLSPSTPWNDSVRLQGAMPSQFPLYTPAEVRRDVFPSSGRQMKRLGAASVGNIDKSLKNFPPPTSINESTARQIECPYCTVVLDRDSFQGQNWIEHVLQDLRPYVCIFEHCKWRHVLYESADQWMMHLNDHCIKQQWTCNATRHPGPIKFESADGYAEHLFSEHSYSYSELRPFVEFGGRYITGKLDAKVVPSCPMCGISIESFESDVDKLCRHIAQELFDYALLAIPDKAPRPSSHHKGNHEEAQEKGILPGSFYYE